MFKFKLPKLCRTAVFETEYLNSILKFAYNLKRFYTGKRMLKIIVFCGGFLPESLQAQPVQQALIQSFCQNHSKAMECLHAAATTHPEPSVFVLLGKIQMKAEKTEVRNIYLIHLCQTR